jgi:hypothetical protein
LWNIAVPHTTRSFRGDTLVRHDVLGVVPTSRPQRGIPFARQGPEGPFPRFTATMGRCDFLTVFSPRFVSFAWRYLGAPAFCPRSAADAWPTDHPGVCCAGCSRSGVLQGTVRISHVPVKPVRSFAMFLRPRCDQARLWVQVSLMPGAAPATDQDEGSRWNFRAQSHSARLVSRLLARLCRTGLVTRRVSMQGFTF